MEALGAYLFVHFKEMEEPEGEQVYFGLSRDGFSWEEVNGGQPVLVSTLGDRGGPGLYHCSHPFWEIFHPGHRFEPGQLPERQIPGQLGKYR